MNLIVKCYQTDFSLSNYYIYFIVYYLCFKLLILKSLICTLFGYCVLYIKS